MSKLLCLEIPVNETANMIHIICKHEKEEVEVGDYLVQYCSKSDFLYALENNKFIEFDSIAYVHDMERPTDEHGWLFKLKEPGWINNIGIRVDDIIMYAYF